MNQRVDQSSEAERIARAEQRTLATLALVLSRTLREQGFSQRQLATRLGVTEGRVSQLLHAESNPTVRSLARIAEVLGRELNIEFAHPLVTETPDDDDDDGGDGDDGELRAKWSPSEDSEGDRGGDAGVNDLVPLAA